MSYPTNIQESLDELHDIQRQAVHSRYKLRFECAASGWIVCKVGNIHTGEEIEAWVHPEWIEKFKECVENCSDIFVPSDCYFWMP